MKTMQTELERLNPDLYLAFQNSMKKATTEWLPSVIPKLSSYNSLPHILGVMRNVDMLLYNEEQGCVNIELNDIELYIMLNSILFHDIGKCQQFLAEDSGHAEISRWIILDHWAELGIKTQRMAKVMSKIVLFHDPYSGDNIKLKDDQQKEIDKLGYKSTVYSYGFVRSKLLAVLLFLADHLDDSFSRVVPGYLEGEHEYVGKFREKIISNYIDKYCQMVCIEIDESLLQGRNLLNPMKKLNGEDIEKSAKKSNDTIINDIQKRTDALINEIGKCTKDEHPDSNEEKNNHLDSEKKIKEYMLQFSDLGKNYAKDIKNMFSVIWEEDDLDKILKDTVENNEAMSVISRDLQLMGIPIQGWYIKSRDLLYSAEKNKDTGCIIKLSKEPILDMEYLEEIIDAIAEMGISIYGKHYHSYDALANYIHEDLKDIEKVKYAVNRVSKILTAHFKILEGKSKKTEEEIKELNEQLCIICDTEGWRIDSKNIAIEIEHFSKKICKIIKKYLGDK